MSQLQYVVIPDMKEGLDSPLSHVLVSFLHSMPMFPQFGNLVCSYLPTQSCIEHT